MRTINKIIIHCSATKKTMQIGVKEINKWHKTRGWNEIGYHYVVNRHGEIEEGRSIEKVGAHCRGQNRGSVGVCMVGGINKEGEPRNNFTMGQFEALEDLVCDLLKEYPKATVHGHNEFAKKACPCFSVKDWWKDINLKFEPKEVIVEEREGFWTRLLKLIRGK